MAWNPGASAPYGNQTNQYHAGQSQLSGFPQRQTGGPSYRPLPGHNQMTATQIQAQLIGQQRVAAQAASQNSLLGAANINSKTASPPRPNNVSRPLPGTSSLGALPSNVVPRLLTSTSQVVASSSNGGGFNNNNPPPRPYRPPEAYPPRGQYTVNSYTDYNDRRRDEVSRLMYACGDVADPDPDAVDYMEDLTVEFLSDLCRPIPPLRPSTSQTQTQTHTPTSNQTFIQPALTAQILRRRLSHSTMSKYLKRFDHMVFMNKELQSSRNIGMPSNQDLVNIAGKEFLGLHEEATEKVKKKIGRPRRERPVDPEGTGRETSEGKNKEKKKPGPKPGWKRRLIEGSETPKRKVKMEKSVA